MKKPNRIIRSLQAIALLLAVICNFALGSLSAKKFTGDIPPLSIVPDTRSLMPTVRIDGVRNGKLEGAIHGDARFVLSETPVLANDDGEFSVNASSVLVNHVSVIVPDGMYFVASKKGKYFYSVTSTKGSSLSPGNRVYFKNEDEARAAGYLAP